MGITQFVVGFIRKPHGYAGECKVESASGEYSHLLKLKEVTLRHGNEEKLVTIEESSLGSNTMYVKFKGIDSSEAIQKFGGWEIVVPRKYAKPLNKGEWYIEDLLNCSIIWNGDPATSVAPAVVGTITDVLEGGAGYLLEVSLSESCTCISDDIKFTASKALRKVLVPFNNEHIGEVNIKNGTVQLMHLWILE